MSNVATLIQNSNSQRTRMLICNRYLAISVFPGVPTGAMLRNASNSVQSTIRAGLPVRHNLIMNSRMSTSPDNESLVCANGWETSRRVCKYSRQCDTWPKVTANMHSSVNDCLGEEAHYSLSDISCFETLLSEKKQSYELKLLFLAKYTSVASTRTQLLQLSPWEPRGAKGPIIISRIFAE
jgi:hypothetical protein